MSRLRDIKTKRFSHKCKISRIDLEWQIKRRIFSQWAYAAARRDRCCVGAKCNIQLAHMDIARMAADLTDRMSGPGVRKFHPIGPHQCAKHFGFCPGSKFEPRRRSASDSLHETIRRQAAMLTCRGDRNIIDSEVAKRSREDTPCLGTCFERHLGVIKTHEIAKRLCLGQHLELR